MRTFVQILTDAGLRVEPYTEPGGEAWASFWWTGTLGNAVADIVQNMIDDANMDPSADDLATVVDALRKMRTYDMPGGVVVYFPGIAAE